MPRARRCSRACLASSTSAWKASLGTISRRVGTAAWNTLQIGMPAPKNDDLQVPVGDRNRDENGGTSKGLLGPSGAPHEAVEWTGLRGEGRILLVQGAGMFEGSEI